MKKTRVWLNKNVIVQIFQQSLHVNGAQDQNIQITT